MLNYASTDSYGTSSPFDVATALGVAGDDWRSTCIIDENDNLRTMILASCMQLDSNIVKYYARIMKASGVSVIAGYHDVAPVNGDDDIISQFVTSSNVVNGKQILDAWKEANYIDGYYYNWAVLYKDVTNTEAYYLPGFPSTQMIHLTGEDTVYRYASFFEGPRPVDTADTRNYNLDVLYELPTTITLNDSQINMPTGYSNREPEWGTTNVADNDSIIINTLITLLGENVTTKPSIQYRVSREEVDGDIGIVPESELVVERTYQYFDTFNGIRIADSFISATIDCNGIYNISVQRKTVPAVVKNAIIGNDNKATATSPISESHALKILLEDHSCLADSELFSISLAYVPDSTGNHILCYEFAFSCGFHYVSVSTGEIIHF